MEQIKRRGVNNEALCFDISLGGGSPQLGWYHQQVTLYNICSLGTLGHNPAPQDPRRHATTMTCTAFVGVIWNEDFSLQTWRESLCFPTTTSSQMQSLLYFIRVQEKAPSRET